MLHPYRGDGLLRRPDSSQRQRGVLQYAPTGWHRGGGALTALGAGIVLSQSSLCYNAAVDFLWRWAWKARHSNP